MKSKIGLFLFVFILLSIYPSFINASEQSLGSFKQNNCIQLIQTCSNCTYVNITSIVYPNGTVTIDNYLMDKTGTVYNSTFCNTNSLGEYIYNTVGDPDGVTITQPVNFIITPSGSVQTTAQGLGSMVFMVLVLSLTIIFGYLGWKLLNNDVLWSLGVFFIVLCFLLIAYNVWLVYEFKLNYTGSTPDAGVPEIIFYIFMTILTAGLLVAFFMLFTKWKVIKEKFKSAIKPEPEDKDDLV